MGRINDLYVKNRNARFRSISVYLNSGDPDIATTLKLIKLCEQKQVDVIELGVPFANSFTDGDSLRRSHDRALQNKVMLEDVLALVEELRSESQIPVVVLADFSHTVKARGLASVIEQVKNADADGILLHGLPPLYIKDYVRISADVGIDPIFSLYPNSSQQTVLQTLQNAKGFVYLVSQYGRTGNAVDFRSDTLRNFYSQLRKQTDIPLMAGFGIKTINDIETLFSSSELDGVIIGSAITAIIEQSLSCETEMLTKIARYLDTLASTKHIDFEGNALAEESSEYTS